MHHHSSWNLDPTRVLTRRELALVLADARRKARRSANGRRNLIVLRLACCCGLRVSEIAQLQFSDLVLDGPRPHLRLRSATTTKGKKARMVPLWWDAGTLADLRSWIADRQQVEQVEGNSPIARPRRVYGGVPANWAQMAAGGSRWKESAPARSYVCVPTKRAQVGAGVRISAHFQGECTCRTFPGLGGSVNVPRSSRPQEVAAGTTLCVCGVQDATFANRRRSVAITPTQRGPAWGPRGASGFAQFSLILCAIGPLHNWIGGAESSAA